ncbi:hypothetical protein ACOSQ4_015694 [Xanthoceras sorbifolium]
MSTTESSRARQLSAVEQKRVVINNNSGEKLVGTLHETGSKEVVIVCHGFQSCKERMPMLNLAVAFQRQGITAYRFDFPGNGESDGSFQYGNYRREAEDLRAVVQHFRAQERLITVIVGHSKGGNVVLLYASKYNDVPVVVNISGRFHLERGIEGRLGQNYLQRIRQNGFIDVGNKKGKFKYRVTEESLMDRLTTDTRAECLMISQDCRVLTVHGSMDKMVPAEDALEFDKFIPNHKVLIIDGADHEYTSHQDELAAAVLDFVCSNCERDRNKQTELPSCTRAGNIINSRI